MDDRFKYRIWDPRKKQMYVDSTILRFCITPMHGLEYIDPEWDPDDTLYDENLIIMQCTGLKDKNGILIYEGDILEMVALGRYFVGWHQEEARFYLQLLHRKITEQFMFDPGWGAANHREIIGNKYETPQLLGMK